jgi:hypothetical protein
MLHAYKFNTMTSLHAGLLRKLAFGTVDELDVVTSVDTQLHNVIARAESATFSGDLKKMWLGTFRWNMMIRQYIDPTALDQFLNAIATKMMARRSRGVAVLRTNMVPVHQNASREWRKWGSCMLAVSFRRNPEPQITLHSRTSYIGYIAQLDLRVAQHIGELIGERIGVAVEDMSFVWQLDLAQYHGFKSMASTLTDDEAYQRILAYDANDRSIPGMRITKKWLDALLRDDSNGVLYGDMRFGQTRRVRKRLHTELFGIDPENNPYVGGDHSVGSQRNAFQVLPHCPFSRLNFDRLATPIPGPSDLVNYMEEDGPLDEDGVEDE